MIAMIAIDFVQNRHLFLMTFLSSDLVKRSMIVTPPRSAIILLGISFINIEKIVVIATQEVLRKMMHFDIADFKGPLKNSSVDNTTSIWMCVYLVVGWCGTSIHDFTIPWQNPSIKILAQLVQHHNISKVNMKISTIFQWQESPSLVSDTSLKQRNEIDEMCMLNLEYKCSKRGFVQRVDRGYFKELRSS